MAQLGRFDHSAAYTTNGQPVSGASVTIYREGATVNGAQSGTSPLAVTVRDLGKLKTGDTVFINTTTSTTYNVSATSGRTSLTLSGFAGTLNLADLDIIVPSNSKPTLYGDDQAGTTTANPLTTSSDGLATCFMEFGAYTYLVSGGGPPALTSKLYHGRVVPSEAPGQIRFADDFAALSTTGGIQEAIDDLPTAGGRVICSAKTYNTSDCVWIHSGVKLEGAGIGATIIKRATGSVTDSSGVAGVVINFGPKDSNGTAFSSGTTGSNISIHNLTVDGNQSSFAGVLTNPATVAVQGIRCLWVDGLNFTNVKVQNTLQGGFYFSSCRGHSHSNLQVDTVGQWSVNSERNGISLLNVGNSATFTNQGTIVGYTARTIGYNDASLSGEGITLEGCQNLDISNVSVDGCDFGIEFTSVSTVTNQDLTFSNMTFRNMRDFGITFNGTQGDASRIIFSDITFFCHASQHDAGIIYLSSSTHSMDAITFNNIIAYNINSADTTSRSWIDCQAGTGENRTLLDFRGCKFIGAGGSTRTGDVGASFRGALSVVRMSDTTFSAVPGIGISLDDSAADTQTYFFFDHVTITSSNFTGIQLRNNTAAATISEIHFDNCQIHNTCLQGGGSVAAIELIAGFALSTINNVYFSECRAFGTATQDYGIKLNQTAGTLGPVYISNCDFSGNDIGEIVIVGTITQLQCNGTKHGTQSLTAVGNTLTLPSKIAHCSLFLDADGNYTLTSTPTIPDGVFEGQRLTLLNVDATPNTIGVSDEAGLAGSNILLDTVWVGGNTLTLNQGDNLTLIWSSGLSAWVQISGANGIA